MSMPFRVRVVYPGDKEGKKWKNWEAWLLSDLVVFGEREKAKPHDRLTVKVCVHFFFFWPQNKANKKTKTKNQRSGFRWSRLLSRRRILQEALLLFYRREEALGPKLRSRLDKAAD
jgi:hypothetical protein